MQVAASVEALYSFANYVTKVRSTACSVRSVYTCSVHTCIVYTRLSFSMYMTNICYVSHNKPIYVLLCTQVIAENRTDVVKLTAPVHSTSPLLLNNDDDVISSGHNYESKLKPLSQTNVADTHASQESTSNIDEGSDSDDTDDAEDEISDESDGDSDSELSFDGVHESTTTTTTASTTSSVDARTADSTNHDHPIPQSIPHCEYPMVLCGDFNTLLETECFDSDTGYTPSSLIELMRTGQVCICV